MVEDWKFSKNLEIFDDAYAVIVLTEWLVWINKLGGEIADDQPAWILMQDLLLILIS